MRVRNNAGEAAVKQTRSDGQYNTSAVGFRDTYIEKMVRYSCVQYEGEAP